MPMKNFDLVVPLFHPVGKMAQFELKKLLKAFRVYAKDILQMYKTEWLLIV